MGLRGQIGQQREIDPAHFMENGKYKLLLVCSHPVQFAAPQWRLMAQNPHLDMTMAFCSLQGAEPGIDPEFGVEVVWDVPLLDGYRWIHVPNRSLRPRLGRFFGLVNTGLWKLIKDGKFDGVLVYGYAYASYWIAFLAAKSAGVPVILGTDATRLQTPYRGWWWKKLVKRPVVQFIYRNVADTIAVPSTATSQFLRSLGIPDEKMVLTHYTVDNDYFFKSSERADRKGKREKWRVPESAPVVLYCAKLLPRKRPQDMIAAFSRLRDFDPKIYDSAYLVLAGEGPMREELIRAADTRGIADRVRFLGFVNQLELPSVYAASDLFVLPSEHEPWGLVVNEAMACGLPVVVSDRVGARLDLVVPGVTGEIYPVGDVEALAAILRRLLSNPGELSRMRDAARARLSTWSYRQHVEGVVEAVAKSAQEHS
jgi:glycosyltransferase involved in cell wall biosynthesis